MSDDDLTPVDPLPAPLRIPTPSEGRRVPPNPDRPPLPARVERKLAAADQRSANAYEDIENANAVLRAALTEGLVEGAVTEELEMTESLVHRVVTGEPKKPG